MGENKGSNTKNRRSNTKNKRSGSRYKTKKSGSRYKTGYGSGCKTTSESSCKTITEDGILCSVISSLTLREAVRTCVLSRRWSHIWTYLPILNFDCENIFDFKSLQSFNKLDLKEKLFFLLQKTDQFIRSVDSVLQQHQGRTRVDKFLVRYFLYKAHSHQLDAWVRFAVATKTKKLCFHLDQRFSKFDVELYEFPFQLLGPSSIEELFLACCSVKPLGKFDGLNHLKILTLWGTNATEEDINTLLSNCPTLEVLSVLKSKELVILCIPQLLRQLNRLFIQDCTYLRKIVINSVNLSYIWYEGVPVDFVLTQPLCLKEAKIHFKTEGKSHNLNSFVTKLARNLPYLRSLTLNFDCAPKDNLLKSSYSFNNLTSLDWECPKRSVGVETSLPYLDTLLDAAPFMKTLKLRLSWCGAQECPSRLKRLTKLLPKRPHSHLKTIEISGFYFERWQVQIVLYLLFNAIELESITLEKGREPVKEIREMDIKNLTEEVPAAVRLLIL